MGAGNYKRSVFVYDFAVKYARTRAGIGIGRGSFSVNNNNRVDYLGDKLGIIGRGRSRRSDIGLNGVIVEYVVT